MPRSALATRRARVVTPVRLSEMIGVVNRRRWLGTVHWRVWVSAVAALILLAVGIVKRDAQLAMAALALGGIAAALIAVEPGLRATERRLLRRDRSRGHWGRRASDD
jgi:hypothetical protein